MTDAKNQSKKPTLIRMKSVIAWPAPKLRNTAKSHGSALGDAEIEATKTLLGLDPQEKFAMPDDVLTHIRLVKDRAATARKEWNSRFDAWKKADPVRAELLTRLIAHDLPAGWDTSLPTFEAGKDVSTRAASGKAVNAIAASLPEFWGGSADLAESNNTTIEGGRSFLPTTTSFPDADPYGRVIHFGIREHAMGSILNGITLHGLSRAFGGTFAVFSDYMRPSVRLAALMNIPTTFIWTHDSIGLGEDGPTHQPIEHLASLRAIPGLSVIRPADANEVSQAWKSILLRREPAGLLLSRQNLPVFARTSENSAALVDKGAYTLVRSPQLTEVVLIATGSEVSVAVASAEILNAQGISTSVVSAPCLEWFAQQSQQYKDQVIPATALRVSIEAGVSMGWREYVGDSGVIISLDHYGASASAGELFKEFGFSAENVVAKVLAARG
jgi:transketolase